MTNVRFFLLGVTTVLLLLIMAVFYQGYYGIPYFLDERFEDVLWSGEYSNVWLTFRAISVGIFTVCIFIGIYKLGKGAEHERGPKEPES